MKYPIDIVFTLIFLFLGYASDKFVSLIGFSNNGNPRHYVFSSCFIITALGMEALTNVEITHKFCLLFIAFIIGFGIYGALSLCGVLAIEMAAEDVKGVVLFEF